MLDMKVKVLGVPSDFWAQAPKINMINNQDLCPLCCIEFELESERLLLALTGSQGKGIFFGRQRHITHGFASRVRKEQSECTEEFWAGQCWASELPRQGMQFTQSVSQSLGAQCKSNLRVRFSKVLQGETLLQLKN